MSVQTYKIKILVLTNEDFWQRVKVGGLSGLFFGLGGTVVGNVKKGQTATPSSTTQQPTTQVNLSATGTNDAGAGVALPNKQTQLRAQKPLKEAKFTTHTFFRAQFSPIKK